MWVPKWYFEIQARRMDELEDKVRRMEKLLMKDTGEKIISIQDKRLDGEQKRCKSDIYDAMAKFALREKQEAEKAAQEEKDTVSIAPDSYVAKEIKYQTAIAHQILEEIRRQTRMLAEIRSLLKLR